MREGKLVVFEGPDGCGKTSVSKEFVSKLHELDSRFGVFWSTEPTYGSVGTLIRRVLKKKNLYLSDECLLNLFMADRLDHAEVINSSLLAKGSFVVLDRYYHSTFAYQSIKYKFELLDTLHNAFIHKVPRPDIVFILCTPLGVASSRIKRRAGGPELFEDHITQDRVRSNYAKIKELSHYCRSDNIVYVDSTGGVSEVAEKCLDICKSQWSL